MRRLFPLWGIGLTTVLLTLGGNTPRAAAESPSSAELVDLLDAAEQNFSWSPLELEARRARDLRTSIAALRSVLQQCNDQNCRGWEAYLQLDEVEAALRAPIAEQLIVLDALRRRLRVDIAGLEHPQVVRLRDDARQYAATLRLRELDVEAELHAAADDLRRRLAADCAVSDAAEADRRGAILGLLNTAGQTPELVDALRAHWAQPNVVLQVSTDFLNRFVAREFADSSLQSATVLGTQSRGVTQTAGRLELVSLFDEERAHLQLHLAGTARAPGNRGRNGPATILSSSVSRFDVVKDLYVDAFDGLRGAPPQVRCRSSLDVRDIDVETNVLLLFAKPLATRYAWNQSREQKAEAEQAVSRLVGERVKRRIDDEVAESLGSLQGRFRQYAYVRPLRHDELPTITSRSTDRFVQLKLTQAGPAQAAAAGPAPPLDDATVVGATLHQSYFNNNSVRGIFGDGEFTDERIERYSQFVAGFVPPTLRVFSTSVPWTMHVDPERPNTVVFDDGAADVTIHLLGWTIGERRYARKIDLHTVYEVTNSSLGMTFTRRGDLEIRPADGRPWSADERSTLLPHLAEKTAAMFPEFGRFNSLIFPKGEGLGPLGLIELRQVACDDGWLTIGYQLHANAPRSGDGQETLADVSGKKR